LRIVISGREVVAQAPITFRIRGGVDRAIAGQQRDRDLDGDGVDVESGHRVWGNVEVIVGVLLPQSELRRPQVRKLKLSNAAPRSMKNGSATVPAKTRMPDAPPLPCSV
jgi:hypothetical protein